MDNRPRYFFAHQIMKSVVFKGGNGLGIMALYEPEKLIRMLNEAWEYANVSFDQIPDEYEPKVYARITEDNKVIIVFSSPEPKEMLDTYYCAFESDGKKTRYFTVEKGNGRDILGEWTCSGHINYGEIRNDLDSIILKIEDVYNKVDSGDVFEIINKNEARKAWKMISNKYKECLGVSEGREGGYVFC